MDDSDSDGSTMDSIQARKKLKATRTKVKRMQSRLVRFLADCSPDQLDKVLLEQFQLQVVHWQKSYDDHSAQLQAVEEDVNLMESDEANYALFDKEVIATIRDCSLLLSLKRVHCSIQRLEASITSLNDIWMGKPEADYSSVSIELTKYTDFLKGLLEDSWIDEGHPLRGQATEACNRANSLKVKMKGDLHKDDKPSLKPFTNTSGYKRAPLHVPTFSGELKEWHTFWNAFRIAIHDAKDLEDSIKLSYLKESMKDKGLQRTLGRFTDDKDAYSKAVKELHNRFDKPKLMHRLYLKNITSLSPVKANQSELASFADTLQESLDGLTRLKQTDASFILTSLASDFLPDKIRMSWEEFTESNRDVAPITDFIEFIRRKTDNPLFADKASGSGHQGSGSQDKRPQKSFKSKGSAHLTVSQPAAPPAPPPSHQYSGQQGHSQSGGSRSSSHKSRGSSHSSAGQLVHCVQNPLRFFLSCIQAVLCGQKKGTCELTIIMSVVSEARAWLRSMQRHFYL